MFTQYETLDPNDECRCGRLTNRVHCPNCGVYGVYARSHKKNTIKTRGDGTEVELQTYQCRRCGRVFDDDDWKLNCQAPRPRQNQVFEGRAALTRQTSEALVAPKDVVRVATLPLTEHPEVASKGLQDYLAMKKAQEAKLQQKLDAKKPSLDDLMKTVNSLLKENE